MTNVVPFRHPSPRTLLPVGTRVLAVVDVAPTMDMVRYATVQAPRDAEQVASHRWCRQVAVCFDDAPLQPVNVAVDTLSVLPDDMQDVRRALCRGAV